MKRKYPLGLHKKNQKPHVLKGRHYVYELVEDTNTRKRANLEVILTAYVDRVGDRGDVISLRPNIAYNNYLLPGLAVYKTEENLQKYARNKSDKETIKHSSPYAQRTVNFLELIVLSVVMNKDNPWVVEPWHIRASLRKSGIIATLDSIELPKERIVGPDMAKQNKEFYVTVTLNNLEKARVKCRIHHWSSDPGQRLPYVFEHYKQPAEPLFGGAELESR